MLDQKLRECIRLETYYYEQRYNLLDKNCHIHLFYSFDGLSKPSEKDMGTNMIEGDYLGTLEEVKSNLSEYSIFKYYKGWIPDRFPDVEDKSFSFVHIDLDFYEPIKAMDERTEFKA